MSLCVVGTANRGGGRTGSALVGPGPNAPSWSGKTVYTAEDFSTDIPIHPASANAAGFKGYQGFSGAFDNVTYPEIPTPFGTKRVLRVTFPGQTENLSALDAATTPWAFRGTEYSDAGVRVTGAWSGTLEFQRSTDGGASWSAFSVSRIGGGSVTTTTTNGTFLASTGSSIELLRVVATAWSSGTATVSVGMRGGQGTGRMDAGSFDANQSKVYTRIVYRTSENWSSNGNTGTKLFFFRQANGDNHYVNLGGDLGVGPSIALQNSEPSTVARTPSATVGFNTPHASWLDMEFLAEANTPGSDNGIGRTWVNGVLCAERTDFNFFYAGRTPAFSQLFFDPTYGGGGNPPPDNLHIDIAYWYRESAA
jgi:hypothetical protein